MHFGSFEGLSTELLRILEKVRELQCKSQFDFGFIGGRPRNRVALANGTTERL